MELSLELRDHLHGVLTDPAEWPRLLMRLADLLGAEEATFGGGSQWEVPRIFAPRTDPGYVGVYMQTYHQQNAFMQSMMQRSLGRVVPAHALPEFAALQHSDFYNLWCAPQHFTQMFGFSLAASDGWWGIMTVNLTDVPSQEQMARLGALIPQVQRAVEMHLLLEQLRSAQTSTLSVLNLSGNGGLLLDRHGRVLEMNAIAEAMLQAGQLRLREGRLRGPDADSDGALSRLVAQCLSEPDRAGAKAQIGIGPLIVQCAPFAGSLIFPAPQRPAAIVIMTDPHQKMRQRLADLQRSYGLTQAEAELAQAVVEAGSRKIAAERRGVTDATARAQLSSIFDKTGVRRQTDLVRLLMGGS
ncbi:helix-turn-helix transcriptional regulator [Devosia chinhatensis]|uniref:HTH luxR-type domain-containing protein n=1 Tax=Devosia chinhatensis TaxID=429727 RepID=A0A0F5FKH9_9HYPH|nr:response regulator transcription factor [Devosia chinhatensis]KKB08717.1 hypothetical protein VE26_01135 [Devosia chinhatensis]